MSIAGLESVSMNERELSTPKSNTLDKDDFLNLLVAQLKAQDPLNPMESTEFTAQLAQFSSLEQLTNVNEKLGNLQVSQDSMINSQAVGFIDKTVTASGNSISLNGGVSDDIHFELGAAASSVLINIYDSTGNFVKTIENGGLNAGQQALKWDGTDSEGRKVPDGVYAFEVLAVNANDEMVNTTSFTTGKVTGVTFKSGNPCLLAGNKEIPVDAVIQVAEDDK